MQMYKYVFKLPQELEGVSAYLDRTGQYVVYAESEKAARKEAVKTAKEEHGKKLYRDLVIIRRENW